MNAEHRETLKLVTHLAKALRCWQQDDLFCEGLTFGQFTILDLVAQAKELSQSELQDRLSVEKSTTTRLLEPIVKKGLLVKRKSSEDQRSIILELTSNGEKTYEKINLYQRNIFQALMKQIPTTKRKEVLEGIELFTKALENCCLSKPCCP
ncbi:MAG: MarR family winged helix-turn-helix transcriptional regulator [Oligoflexales bacterium]